MAKVAQLRGAIIPEGATRSLDIITDENLKIVNKVKEDFRSLFTEKGYSLFVLIPWTTGKITTTQAKAILRAAWERA